MPSAKSLTASVAALGLSLEVKSAQLVLDEGQAPYGSLQLVCVAPPAALRDRLDPRAGLRVTGQASDLRTPWDPDGIDVVRPFDLGLRSRPLQLTDAEVQLTASTDEALLISGARIATTTYAPVSVTVRQVVAYVLAAFGMVLQPGTDDAQLLPNTVTWAPGQTGWEVLEPLLQAGGLRLFCDELRRWRLVRSDQLGAGYLQLRHDQQLTRVGDVIDLDSGGYYDAVVVTYTYADATGMQRTSYDVARPDSGVYDLTGSGPWAQQSAPQQSGGGASVMQGVTQPVPGPTGDLYAWHAVAGTQTGLETLVIDRCSNGGALQDSMTLTNGGHGTSLGLEVDAAGKIWVWLHWQYADTGLAHDLIRVPYVGGATYTRAAAIAAGAQVLPHSWVDVGGAVPVTSYDWANDYAVMHLGSTVAGKRAYVRRRISDLRAGVNVQYGATILIPEGPPTLQGFTTCDESFFRYVGAANEPATDRAAIEEYSWADGSLIDLRSTSELGRRADGTYLGDRHEPEGLQVYRAANGSPSLDVGLLVGAAGSYQGLLFRLPLKERAATGALRVLALEYPTPKPAPGAARAILKRRSAYGRSLPLTAVSDFTATPGMPASLVLEDGADELQVSLSSITWRIPDDEMDVTTRDVVPIGPTAWLRARPGTGWTDVPAGVSWAAYDPTTDYSSSTSWSRVPVGTGWDDVPAGVAWLDYIEHGSAWQQVPAGVSWASVAAGTSWGEYNPAEG